MADTTYRPKVYRDLGGDRLNVVSGGALNVEAGSTNSIAGVVAFTGANTHSGIETHSGAETHSGNETHSGIETFSGAFRQTDSNPNATTAGAAIVGEGITVLAATSGIQPVFALAAPVNGAEVHLIYGQAGSSDTTVSTTAASATIGSTFTSLAFLANAYGSAVLRGRSATRWDVISLHGASLTLS